MTSENATVEIDRVLNACLLEKQPVCINLPMDVASTEVNDGYTIERDIHGEKMPYSDIQRWNYHKLHEVFGDNGWGIKGSTEGCVANTF